MENIFQIITNDTVGMQKAYNLRPASYRTSTQFQNQVFMNNLRDDIIITNDIQVNHTINAGESVYVKISISKAVILSNALKTGEITVSNNNGEQPEKWMTIEEVESEEWEAVIIECPEENVFPRVR
jgi:hypothetical protein